MEGNEPGRDRYAAEPIPEPEPGYGPIPEVIGKVIPLVQERGQGYGFLGPEVEKLFDLAAGGAELRELLAGLTPAGALAVLDYAEWQFKNIKTYGRGAVEIVKEMRPRHVGTAHGVLYIWAEEQLKILQAVRAAVARLASCEKPQQGETRPAFGYYGDVFVDGKWFKLDELAAGETWAVSPDAG